jgi:hypothetical protein
MIKAYLVPSLKTLGTLVAGAVLAVVLWNGYYYWQLAKWVDSKRTYEIIQQANQQQQRAAQAQKSAE